MDLVPCQFMLWPIPVWKMEHMILHINIRGEVLHWHRICIHTTTISRLTRNKVEVTIVPVPRSLNLEEIKPLLQNMQLPTLLYVFPFHCVIVLTDCLSFCRAGMTMKKEKHFPHHKFMLPAQNKFTASTLQHLFSTSSCIQ